jgi:GntR family transcriptional regulator, transcriptional repressor for pyruvate dehydrogenase complex
MSRVDHVTQIAAELEQAILSGELAPGDLLPSERDISARRGVSRSVVREALGRLASLGLVRSVHGSGTRVEAPSSRPVTMGYQRLLTRADCRLEDLAAVRLPLETTIAALAATRRTDADLERLEKTQQVLGKPRRSLEAHVAADVEFHAALADATGNPLFRVVLAPIQQLLIDSRRRTLGRYGSEIAFRHHVEILAAVRAHDAEAATAAMRRHLEANIQHLHEAEGNGPTAP